MRKVRKDQSGVTLIELLSAIVILSIIIVPIFTILTDSYSRTAHQEEEAQLLFYAQQVLEEVKTVRGIECKLYTGGRS